MTLTSIRIGTLKRVIGTPFMLAGRNLDRFNASTADSVIKFTGFFISISEIVPSDAKGRDQQHCSADPVLLGFRRYDRSRSIDPPELDEALWLRAGKVNSSDTSVLTFDSTHRRCLRRGQFSFRDFTDRVASRSDTLSTFPSTNAASLTGSS